MKGHLAILLIMCLLFTAPGCIVVHYTDEFDCEYPSEEITEILIYDVGDEGVFYNLDESCEPVGSIGFLDRAAFIGELEAMVYDDIVLVALAAVDADHTFCGYIVKIQYQDGSYELVSADIQGVFHANGRHGHTFHDFGEETWTMFIEKYLG